MNKETTFTFRIDEKLKSEFLAFCVEEDIPAAQVLRDLIRRVLEDSKKRGL